MQRHKGRLPCIMDTHVPALKKLMSAHTNTKCIDSTANLTLKSDSSAAPGDAMPSATARSTHTHTHMKLVEGVVPALHHTL